MSCLGAWPRALAVLLVALLLVPVSAGQGAGVRPGSTTYVSLWANPSVAVEGTNISLLVNVSNPSPVSLVIRLLLFVIADPHETPIPFGSLQNISLPANTNISVPYWWVATAGDHTLAVYATLEFSGSLIPLPPAEYSVSISSKTTSDVLTVLAYLLLGLAWLFLLVSVPSIFASVRGRGARPPARQGPRGRSSRKAPFVMRPGPGAVAGSGPENTAPTEAGVSNGE